MDILVGLAKRLNVDVGGVFVSTHDSEGQSSALNDSRALNMDSGHHLHKGILNEVPSRRLRSQDKINAVGSFSSTAGDSTKAPTFHPDPGNAASTFNDNRLFGQINSASHLTDNEIEGLFTGMNFDFDPLFGFDMD